MPLTPEQQALREAAEQATPGKWSWWTSNSYLRLSSERGGDGDILHGARLSDGCCTVNVSEANRTFIERAYPAAILALLAQLEAQEAPSLMDNLRKNDPAFAAHLDRCSAEVATWPKWKRMGYEVVPCDCEKCRPHELFRSRMILCGICGNKRCPHATDHALACTNSNEPGQPGSSYGPPLSETAALSQPVQPDTDKLLAIIASAYQIAGAHDAPAHILDVLADPEAATVEQVEAMLPYQVGWGMPAVLFDGMAVYEEVRRKAGHMRTSPDNVSDVLDAVVRLIRAAPAGPDERKE